MVENIKKLSEAFGPSGHEDEAAELFAKLLKPFVAEVHQDALGNVVGCRPGAAGAGRVLLEAHLDEVGFVVTGLDEGFAKFDTFGRVDPRYLPAAALRLKGGAAGIVSVMPPHVLTAEAMKKAPELKELVLDVGGLDIEPGTPGVFDSPFTELAGGLISGKALDNRACAAVLIDALAHLPADGPEIVVLGSVQEELGLRGAKTGAYGLEPDYALVLDATFGYASGLNKRESFALGEGPAIGRGPAVSRKLSIWVEDVARALEISYQIEVMSGGSGTDADVIGLTQAGIPTGLISLPVRYMHSPVETASLADAESMSKLVTTLLSRPVREVV